MKTIQKINESQSWFFEKIARSRDLLPRKPKEKEDPNR